MQPLVREIYKKTGYVYAKSPAAIAEEYGYSEVARLASNENPFDPSEKAVEAVKKAASGINRYPDVTCKVLQDALLKYHGDYNFITGVGMDGVIETSLRLITNPGDKVVISVPTFSFYALSASAQGANVITVPREADFSVDIKAFVKASKDARISFLCTPNNPSGTITSPDDIRYILENIDGMLFLDNAYVEFSNTNYTQLIEEFDNLIIGRTMSKVFGLAGCRVGYAFVPKWFKPLYEQAETPFTLNNLSMAAAAGAFEDIAYAKKMISYTKKWIAKFRAECPLPVIPGEANFVMIDTGKITSDEYTDALAKKGVLVRSCRSFPGIEDHYIRVCVGKPWENERFLKAVKDLSG